MVQGSGSLNFPKIFRKISLILAIKLKPFRVSIPYFFTVQGPHPLFILTLWSSPWLLPSTIVYYQDQFVRIFTWKETLARSTETQFVDFCYIVKKLVTKRSEGQTLKKVLTEKTECIPLTMLVNKYSDQYSNITLAAFCSGLSLIPSLGFKPFRVPIPYFCYNLQGCPI